MAPESINWHVVELEKVYVHACDYGSNEHCAMGCPKARFLNRVRLKDIWHGSTRPPTVRTHT